GGDALAPHGLAAGELDKFARDQAAGHRDHFDRQRELAQYVDALGRIDDAHELRAGLGNDLFPGQGGTAALDQALGRVALVGAVDVERQRAGIVQFQDFDAVAAQARRALFGAGDRTGDAMPDPRQRIDEEGDGRAGADADDAAVLDVIDGLFAGQALGFGHFVGLL